MIFAHSAREHPPKRTGKAVPSCSTSPFNANLFLGINYATLIFTQLCSSAQWHRCHSTCFRFNLSGAQRIGSKSPRRSLSLARISFHDRLLASGKRSLCACSLRNTKIFKSSAISHCSTSFFLFIPSSQHLSSFNVLSVDFSSAVIRA